MWPVILIVTIFYGLVEFHKKATSFWSNLFPEKNAEPPTIKANMIIRHETDSTISYNYEITNMGKGIAKISPSAKEIPNFPITTKCNLGQRYQRC